MLILNGVLGFITEKRVLRKCPLIVFFSLLPTILIAGLLELDRAPINYKTAPVYDRIHLLQQQLEAGTAKLEWDEQRGWLPSILKHLDVSRWTQTLVFSKTSLQISRISPATPRALYFNDDTYVGWVKHGDVIELSAVDPEQGAIFYTLSQRKRTSVVDCKKLLFFFIFRGSSQKSL